MLERFRDFVAAARSSKNGVAELALCGRGRWRHRIRPDRTRRTRAARRGVDMVIATDASAVGRIFEAPHVRTPGLRFELRPAARYDSHAIAADVPQALIGTGRARRVSKQLIRNQRLELVEVADETVRFHVPAIIRHADRCDIELGFRCLKTDPVCARDRRRAQRQRHRVCRDSQGCPTPFSDTVSAVGDDSLCRSKKLR